MKVVLKENVKNFGRKGDVKEVSDGYANNFLFPRGLAAPASKGVIVKIADKKSAEAREEEKFMEKLKAAAESPLEFRVKTGPKGEIFSSVKKEDIEEALKQVGFSGVRAELDKPIKQLGETEVIIGIGRGIKGKIKITVLPSK